MSMSQYRADLTLNEALTGTATPHMLLHTGDPGADGTANIALADGTSMERKSVSFGDPANETTNGTPERKCENDVAVEFSGEEIDSGQTITHFSIWDGDDASTPDVEFVDEVIEAKETGSDGVTIGIGDLEVAIEVHAHEA